MGVTQRIASDGVSGSCWANAPFAAGHAAGDGGVGDRLGDRLGDVAVEDAGDDVVGVEFILWDHVRDRVCGGELHFLVDRAGADLERAFEDAGECEHVVDLVGVVRAPGGDDRDVVADLFGGDLGHRIGHREHDRARSHPAHRGG